MLLQKSLRIFTLIILLTPFYASSAEQKPEDQNPPIEQKPTEQVIVNPPVKITTQYSLKNAWKPFVGAAIVGLGMAASPAILASLSSNIKNDEIISVGDQIGASACVGATFAIILGTWFLHLDAVKQCSICGRVEENKESVKSRLLKFVGTAFVGALEGAGLCAIIHQFYPDKLPTKINNKDIIKFMGLYGASLGFLAGIEGMKEDICSDCQSERKLLQM